MRRVLLGLCLAGILVGAAWAQSGVVIRQPPAEIRPPSNITSASKPGRDGPGAGRLPSFYPREAADRTVTGRVEIVCGLTPRDRLTDCEVVSEAPVGMGFGAAALKKLNVGWRMKPRRVDATPEADGRVRFTVRFSPERTSERPLLQRPVWSAAPSFDDMRAAWPAGVGDIPSGAAALRCGATPEGRLRNCRVIGVFPKGSSFAAAALGMADKFRISASPDGSTGDETDIVVSLTFLNPQTAVGQSRRIRNPDWIDLSGTDRAYAPFPKAAEEAGVKVGVGVVDCMVAPDGRLTDCVVAREDPVGLGFGASALAWTPGLRVNPWTPEGRPAYGVRIRAPILFDSSPSTGGTKRMPPLLGRPGKQTPGGGD